MHFTIRALATAAAIATTFLGHLHGAQAQAYGTADCLLENCSPSQSGYLDSYNFDPAVVGSSSFGQLWNVNPGRAGQVFLAQPITYTPSGGSQSVIVASEDNNVYVLDAATGAARASINTQAPFLATDTKCTDIVPNIGITGTPYLDANLQTLYFWSKGYVDGTGTTTGLDQGRYKFYGVDPVTLKTKFVTDPQGIIPNNRRDQRFEGGKVLQRPGLTELNGVIWAAFGGHCDNFNYTGWMVGMDAKTGAVVDSWVTQAGPFGTVGSGIWMAGAGIANDGKNLWVVTGNGYGEELNTAPRIGSSPPQALPMSVIRLGVGVNGTIGAQDFFTPSDFRAIDAADQDFGSSGVCFLPSGFSTSSVKRIAIANGKNSKAYIMNADNLGGYKTGAGGGDGNLQTIPLNGPSFSTVGGYPLEGGYIYISATSSPTIAFKLSTDANGDPNFVQVGQTNDSSTGTRGIGHTTTTSFNGQPGSGLLWVTDLTNGNLRVYPAIPPASGNMQAIFLGAVPNGNIKYQRPVPGDGRMFIVGTFGSVTAYGSPVNQPLNCTTPLSYGNVIVGTNVTLSVTCKAVIGTTIANVTQSDTALRVTGFPAVGTAYTTTSPAFAFNVTYSPTKFGPFTGSVLITLQNAQAGYVTSQPIVVRGTALASKPTFQLAPSNVAFGGLVPGSSETIGGLNKSVQLSNVGLGTLTVLAWDFDETWTLGQNNEGDDNDGPATDPDGSFDNNTTTGNFTLYGMPTTIGSQAATALTLNFNPSINGEYQANLTIYTSGGNFSTLLTGNADGPPKMIYAVQQYDGSVLANTPYMDFGNVIAGNSSQLVLSVTDIGESALTLTKSKPPNDQFIHAVNPASDLTEGQVIGANATALGPVVLVSQAGQVNTPPTNVSSQWVLNSNDPTFNVTFVHISGRIVSRQVGPRLATPDPWDKNGTARFGYLGCYTDSTQSRTLPNTLMFGSTPAENGACQNIALASGISNFVGTEYGSECYSGFQPPPASAKVNDLLCEMPCAGDSTQVCGDSSKVSVFYDKLSYNATSGQLLPGAFVGPQNKPNVTASDGAAFTYAGCAADGGAGNRLLSTYTYSDTVGMTVESCVAACESRGLPIAGLEYAQECYCGTALSASVNTNQTGCTMSCKGSRNEFCGGSSRLSLYVKNGTALTTQMTSSSTASSTATGTATSSTPSSQSPTATPTATGIVSASGSYKYQGCWQEPSGNSRALNAILDPGSPVTVENCVATCQSNGYSIAGIENGQECWCGNGLALGSVQVNDSQCATTCAGNSFEICGGPLLLSAYSPSAISPATQPASVGNYTFQGCFNDTVTARALTGPNPGPSNANSLERCASACAGFSYFGTEYGVECYCGNQLSNGATVGDVSKCSMSCSGNGTELCGAGNQLSVYFNPNPVLTPGSTSSAGSAPLPTSTTGTPTATSTATPTGSATIVLSASGLRYQGCWHEPSGTRMLATRVAASSSMTVQSCVASCLNAGYSIAGLEYSQECWCGNGVTLGSTEVADSQCTNTCSGDATQLCGGSFLLTTYAQKPIVAPHQPANVGTWTSQGCFNDSTGARTLQGSKPVLGSSNTLENCATACAGYNFFGTEYSDECYCGNAILSGALAGDPSKCSMTCTGNNTELCGGSNALSLYQAASAAAGNSSVTTSSSISTMAPTSSSISSSSVVTPTTTDSFASSSLAPTSVTTTVSSTSPAAITTTSTSTTSSAPVVSPTIVPSAGGLGYQGCWHEPSGGRMLATRVAAGSNMTVQSCVSSCLSAGYSIAGIEYSQECWCGSAVTLGSTQVADSQCTNTCSGDATQLCGGSFLLTTYAQNPIVAPHQPATVGTWTFLGCFNDSVGTRVLQGSKPTLGSSNTLESCAAACAGYTFFGTEYSDECYCGYAILNGGVAGDPTQCVMSCSGDSSELCGGSNLLSVYQAAAGPSAANASSTAPSTATSSNLPATKGGSMTATTSPSATPSITSIASSASLAISTSSTISSSAGTSTSSSSTTSTASATKITSSTSSTTSTTSASSASPSLTGLNALGCYADSATNRTLSVLGFSNPSNTPSFCASYCRGRGYKYSGTETAKNCYCGNFILNQGASLGSGQTGCTQTCPGDGTQKCGGTNRINIVQDTTWQQSVFTVDRAGKWVFQDCYVDGSGARVLNVTVGLSTSITAEVCLNACATKKLAFCGLSGGSTCYGGNALNASATISPSMGVADPLARGCSTVCKGNSTQACGGTSRLDLYKFDSAAASVSPATVQISS